MSFKSINQVLGNIQRSEIWQEQVFPRLLKCWVEVVGTPVADQTRPLSIQRDVVWVATSSAAWAQNLTFGRKTILMKLNDKLSTSLVDIRFSTAEWKNSSTTGTEPTVSAYEHPSYVVDDLTTEKLVISSLDNALGVFENWAKKMQERSHHLPLCPQCQCPTPPGELERWDVCSLCCTKLLG
jgi:predicted nucleic acid-binding Zn ribbon protein